MLKPVNAEDGAEHHEDEERAGDVDARHQLAQREQRADAVPPDRERHRAERADRRQPHDQANDVEQDVGDLGQQVDYGLQWRAQAQQRQAEENGHEQHLDDLALRERADHRVGNDVENEVDAVQLLRGVGVGRDRLQVRGGRVEHDSGSGLHDVDHDQADGERQRRDDFEVDERAEADAADLLHGAHLGNADDHGREHDRRDQHPHELDEAVAERPHGDGPLG